MTQTELNEVLRLHKLWINHKAGGKRAYLAGANLTGADLRSANLRYADLIYADLTGADLAGADLAGADLAGANLYKTSLPLWCGGLAWRLDRLQMAQLAYHFCSMQCDDDDVKNLQKSLYALANEFADSRGDLRSKKYGGDS